MSENNSENNNEPNENNESNPTLVIVGASKESIVAIAEAVRQYDANAAQVVFVDVDDDGQKFQVEHAFNPHSDEHFFQFAGKRETLLKTNDANKKIRLKNKATEAYLWFWDLFCTAVAGYGDPDEAMPENWRDLVPEEDKISAVQGLFTAQIIPKKKKEDKKFLGWTRRQGAEYKLDVLFDGDVIQVEHRLKAKDAELTSDWTELSGAVEFEPGQLLESNDEMSIPASAREKVPFFDKLVESSTNYRGRVPAFIKLLIVNDYFAATGKTGKKPKTSTTQ